MVVSSAANAVRVRDIPLTQAMYALTRAETLAEKASASRQVEEITASHKDDEAIFRGIVETACVGADVHLCVDHYWTTHAVLSDMFCHKTLINAVFDSCPRREGHQAGGWNGYNLQFSQVLVNLCEGKDVLSKNDASLKQIVINQCQRAISMVDYIVV